MNQGNKILDSDTRKKILERLPKDSYYQKKKIELDNLNAQLKDLKKWKQDILNDPNMPDRDILLKEIAEEIDGLEKKNGAISLKEKELKDAMDYSLYNSDEYRRHPEVKAKIKEKIVELKQMMEPPSDIKGIDILPSAVEHQGVGKARNAKSWQTMMMLEQFINDPAFKDKDIRFHMHEGVHKDPLFYKMIDELLQYLRKVQ